MGEGKEEELNWERLKVGIYEVLRKNKESIEESEGKGNDAMRNVGGVRKGLGRNLKSEKRGKEGRKM